MSRRSVDFAFIRPEHLPKLGQVEMDSIHGRLLNWARWCNPDWARGYGRQPMFGGYVSPEHWDNHKPSMPIQTEPAMAIEHAIGTLAKEKGPKHNKQMAAAVRWWYVLYRFNPHRVASHNGVTLQGLADLVHAAREVLAHIKK